mmetsp:Transcript_29993/g.33477  ORF Transcript_29993/g.33477 Transcript_29993/m.33477 type:complete len:282 (+) Transcript_29993:127-972(+)
MGFKVNGYYINGKEVHREDGFYAYTEGTFVINNVIVFSLRFVSNSGVGHKFGTFPTSDAAMDALRSIDRSQIPHGSIIRIENMVYHHYGIFDRDEREVIEYTGDATTGIMWIGSKGSKANVQASSMDTWLCKSLTIVVVPEPDTKLKPNEVVERARNQIGNDKSYHLIYNNCEHFAYEMKTGISKSSQVKKKAKKAKKIAVISTSAGAGVGLLGTSAGGVRIVLGLDSVSALVPASPTLAAALPLLAPMGVGLLAMGAAGVVLGVGAYLIARHAINSQTDE